jgi:GxxExxY protein
MTALIYENETYQIVGACMAVHRELGFGFLEAVYQEALAIELKHRKIPHVRENVLTLYYKETKLQKLYIVDFICYNHIILEIKALSKLSIEHESQLLNYLKATNMKLGFLINFGEKSLKYKRLIK